MPLPPSSPRLHLCRPGPRWEPLRPGSVTPRFLKGWQQGQPADTLAALERFPELWEENSVVVDLAYEEFCQLRKAGGPLDIDAFSARFPPIQNALVRLIGLEHWADETVRKPVPEPPPWPEPGMEFCRFILRRELGRGTFSRVFLAAEQALGDRLVALKVCRAAGAEAAILGRLVHPNIVPIHSVQQHAPSGLTVTCMPYLGSATLCDVLDAVKAQPGVPDRASIILEAVRAGTHEDVPASVGQAPASVLRQGSYVEGVLHLAVQLAEALAYVHSQGIRHSDLKPSNVLLSPDGRPLLLDFNLSFKEQAAEHELRGTLPYVAPEQLKAAIHKEEKGFAEIDARADLFSLGVILYELLAGQHPFDPTCWTGVPFKKGMRRLLECQHRGVPALRGLNPRVDKSLARLLEQCLALDAKDRPASAAELATGLRNCLSGPGRAPRWLARHVLAVAAAALLSLTIGLAAVHFLMPAAASSEQQWRQGVDAYRRHDYDQALQFFDQALAVDPNLARAKYATGRAYQQKGQYDLALLTFAKTHDPALNGPTQASWGFCANRMDSHPEAIDHYLQALAHGFESSGLFNNLGYSYFRLGKLDEAEESLNKAVSLDRESPVALYNRAVVLWNQMLRKPVPQQGVPRQGLADIQKAISLMKTPASEVYWTAAHVCAFASSYESDWVEPTLDCLEQALALGRDTKQLNRTHFQALENSPRFQRLIQQPTRPIPGKEAVRLVDPVPDLGDD